MPAMHNQLSTIPKGDKDNIPIQNENHASTKKGASVKGHTREIGHIKTTCVRVDGAQGSGKSTEAMCGGVDANMDDMKEWGTCRQCRRTRAGRRAATPAAGANAYMTATE